MNRVHRIGSEPTLKLLVEFSLPAIVAMLVQSSYSIIDRIFIGNGAGTMAISGITVCFPVIAVFIAFGMLIGIGGSSLYSIKAGERRQDECTKIIGNTFLLLIITSIILSLITGLFLENILRISGASGGALYYAKIYLGILIFAIPFQMTGYGMNNFIRAEGRPGMAMTTMLIGTFMNLILAPVFIFIFGMGIQGAALSTVIAQVISCMWVMHYFFSGKSLTRLRISGIRLSKKISYLTASIGLGPFSMQLGSCMVASVYNHQLMKYGDELSVSVYGILHSITVFLLMPVIGICQGAQPVIGYNYGSGRDFRAKQTFNQSIILSAAIIICGYLAVITIPDIFISIFNPEDMKLRQAGTDAIRTFLTLLPLAVLQVCTSGYFLATGKAKQSIILTLSRQIIFLVPALLILPSYYGLHGIWLAAPVSDFCSFIISAAFYYRIIYEPQPRKNTSRKFV